MGALCIPALLNLCYAVVWTEGAAGGGERRSQILSFAMFFLKLLVLLLLSGSLMRVSGLRLENYSEYTACINNPSTCTSLYVPLMASSSLCSPSCVSPGRSCPRTR